MIPIEELMKLSHDLSILYVEDDVHIRVEMHEILEDFFHVVILAKDGEEGFKKFEQYKQKTDSYPDIVMTDLMMPKTNGVEMSKKVLALNYEQLIIVLSAHNESNYLLDLINIGIEHYLVKPVDSVQLLHTLQRTVKKTNYRKMELQYTKELEELAYRDPMTGIANRRRFFQKANTLFPYHKFNHSPIYLFIIDIDKFKVINDTFGHDMGDEVIRVFVDCVQKELCKSDCFARLGGDEFVLMLQSSKTEALSTIKSIEDCIAAQDCILDRPVSFSVTTGMTEITPDDKNIDVVMKRADVDLYREKRLKR